MIDAIKNIINNLVNEVKKSELIHYNVACDKYWHYYEIDLRAKENERKFLREDPNNDDFEYFDTIRHMIHKFRFRAQEDEYYKQYPHELDLDQQIYENLDLVLKVLNDIEEPNDALAYYSDDMYINIINSIIEQAHLLNKTLKKSEQVLEANNLKKIEVLQKKKYVSPKELQIIFPRMSISSQKNFRGRLKDKLPYYQEGNTTSITYDVDEVKLWMQRNNKN